MARRNIIIIATLVLAAAAAALYLGLSRYSASPAGYSRVLSQYLKSLSAGDKDGALSLTSGDFVNELSDVRLSPGNFKAYDFGFQGPAVKDTATIRFLVLAFDGEGEAAYLADAVFARKGFRTTLTAVRKISRGRPIID